jgi:hypothetical protein
MAVFCCCGSEGLAWFRDPSAPTQLGAVIGLVAEALRCCGDERSAGQSSASRIGTSPTVFAEVAKFTRVCAYDRPGTPLASQRHGRFRDSDIFRQLFEAVVKACMDAGLVKGEGFAVDASAIRLFTALRARIRR